MAYLDQNRAPDSQLYRIAANECEGLYDGLGSESSTYQNTHNGVPHPPYPLVYPTMSAALIPVKLDIGAIYEDYDKRRKKNACQKSSMTHVDFRRRAQNRAAQRAFRDRKEKHIQDLEERLAELEGRHNNLSQSYESLQVEYSTVKQELDKLQTERSNRSRAKDSPTYDKPYDTTQQSWEEFEGNIIDPLSFDISAFYFHPEESEELELFT